MRAFALGVLVFSLTGCIGDALNKSQRKTPQQEEDPYGTGRQLQPGSHPPATSCQTGGLIGRICNAGSNNAVADAKVIVDLVDCDGKLYRYTTRTRSNGQFAMGDLPAGQTELWIEKDSFKKSIPVFVTGGQVTVLPNEIGGAEMCTGEAAPRVAVIEGEYDSVERVLGDLGIGYEIFEAEPYKFPNGPHGGGSEVERSWHAAGQSSPAYDFLNDLTRMKQFDAIYLTCGDVDRDVFKARPEGQRPDRLSFDYGFNAYRNIRKFVEDGGNLYISDWAWPFAESLNPDALDFYGDEIDATETLVGLAEERTGYVEDAKLEAFLARGDVTVEFDLHGWAVLENVSDGVTTHLSGDVRAVGPSEGLPWTDTNREEIAGAPLVVSYQPFVNGGHVVFTTFHQHAQIDARLGQVLRFLVYRL